MTAYKLDYAAFGVHVLNAPWMVEHMRSRAERGKAIAEATAPYDPHQVTHYRDAFTADAAPFGGVHHDRAEGILRNTDGAALAVEFGNRNTPEHATLRKALDVMGA